MDETTMYKGFDPGKQAAHEAELVARFGEGVRSAIEIARKAAAGTTLAELDRGQAEFGAIETAMAEALRSGAPADSEAVQVLVRRLHDWVEGWWGAAPTRARFAGLADFYVDHPEFRERYEARMSGLAEYLQAAMKAFAERELA